MTSVQPKQTDTSTRWNQYKKLSKAFIKPVKHERSRLGTLSLMAAIPIAAVNSLTAQTCIQNGSQLNGGNSILNISPEGSINIDILTGPGFTGPDIQIVRQLLMESFGTVSATYIKGLNNLSILATPNTAFTSLVEAVKVNQSANIAGGANFDTQGTMASVTGKYGLWANSAGSPASGYIAFKTADGTLGFLELSFESGTTSGTNSTITLASLGLAADNTITTISAGDCTSLPVELIYFKATPAKAAVQLSWQTASEINNAGFEVQRSEDGKSYHSVAFVEGMGTTNETQDYVFEDKQLRSGQLYYYRLKQIDFDGTFEFSDIVTAQTEGSLSAAASFVPNPVASELTQLNYTAPTEGQLQLQLFDVSGKNLLSIQQDVIKGLNQLPIDMGNLAVGMYFVKLQQGETSLYERIIKK